MTKILVISDTHEDSGSMEWTLDYLKTEKIDTVIHLGDYYDDASVLESYGHDLIRVPGTWDACYYSNPDIANRKFIKIEGWRIFLTHTPNSHYNDLDNDITPESVIVEGSADIFLYGHTHITEIKQMDGMVFINPGHMTSDENRGWPMTYSLLEIDAGVLRASVTRFHDNKQILLKEFEKTLLRIPIGM